MNPTHSFLNVMWRQRCLQENKGENVKFSTVASGLRFQDSRETLRQNVLLDKRFVKSYYSIDRQHGEES